MKYVYMITYFDAEENSIVKVFADEDKAKAFCKQGNAILNKYRKEKKECTNGTQELKKACEFFMKTESFCGTQLRTPMILSKFEIKKQEVF